MSDGAKQLISLRLDKRLLDEVERAREKIAADRGTGAREVSLTETVQILITHGLYRIGVAGDEGGASYESLADEDDLPEIADVIIDYDPRPEPDPAVQEAIKRLRRELKEKHGVDLTKSKKVKKAK